MKRKEKKGQERTRKEPSNQKEEKKKKKTLPSQMQERTPNQVSMQALWKKGNKLKNTDPDHQTIWMNWIPQCRRPGNLTYGVLAEQTLKTGEKPSLRLPPVVLLFWNILTPHKQCFCQTTKPSSWSAGHLWSWGCLCGPGPCWCSFLRSFVRELATSLHFRPLSRVFLSERARFWTAEQQILWSMIHVL